MIHIHVHMQLKWINVNFEYIGLKAILDLIQLFYIWFSAHRVHNTGTVDHSSVLFNFVIRICYGDVIAYETSKQIIQHMLFKRSDKLHDSS